MRQVNLLKICEILLCEQGAAECAGKGDLWHEKFIRRTKKLLEEAAQA